MPPAFPAAGTVTAAVFLAAAGLLLPPRIALAAAAGAVLAGAAAVHDHRSLKLDGLPERNVYGTFRVKVTDRRITAVPVSRLPGSFQPNCSRGG